MLALPTTGRLRARPVLLQHVALRGIPDEFRGGDGRDDDDRVHCHHGGREAEARERVEGVDGVARRGGGAVGREFEYYCE